MRLTPILVQTGTEVAHLVPPLKGTPCLDPGSLKFRAIATTASLPNVPTAAKDLRSFVANLFGEPIDRFSLIRLESPQTNLPERLPRPKAFQAFIEFQKNFDSN